VQIATETISKIFNTQKSFWNGASGREPAYEEALSSNPSTAPSQKNKLEVLFFIDNSFRKKLTEIYVVNKISLKTSHLTNMTKWPKLLKIAKDLS
jgi:hypothetical protein